MNKTTVTFDKQKFATTKTDAELELLHIAGEDQHACAITITFGCGHFNDPTDCQGLAHLLEHCLFMGNQFQTEPNQVVSEIEQIGGQINALTAGETMTFLCRFPLQNQSQILTLLANLVSQPLLLEQSIAQEIETIDAEFIYKRKDDLRRLYQVHKETCNQEHPFSQFSVGNKAIFQQHSFTKLRDLLGDYHQRYFVAPNCKIALISPQSHSQAITALSNAFSCIPAASGFARCVYPELYLDAHKQQVIAVESLSEARRLIATFTLGKMTPKDIETLSFISHMLGDEGPGSILSMLKDKNWIISLSAGGGIEGSNFKDFNINMQLTPAAEDHIYDIIHCILTYIEKLRVADSLEWRIEEKAQLNVLFNKQRKYLPDPDLASHFAEGLLYYDLQQILDLQSNQVTYDANDVLGLLEQLTPANLRIKSIAKSIETDTLAKWYDTPYKRFSVPAESLTLWTKTSNPHIDLSALQLPSPNPYIGRQQERRKARPQKLLPERLWHSPSAELLWATDALDNSAKADAYLSLDCPYNTGGARVHMAKKLWLACLNDLIQQRYYAAEIAGLNYRIYGHQGGLSIHTSGFGYKQKHLLNDLLEEVFSQTDFSTIFQRLQSTQIDSLKNHLLNKPVNRLFTRLGVIIQRYSYAPQTLLEHARTLSLEETMDVRGELLSEHFMQAFLHGEWRDNDAQSIIEQMQQKQDFNHSVAPINRDVLTLPASTTYFQQVDSVHGDAAALIFLQAPTTNELDTALTIVLEQLLATPFFEQLRTKKQLGYVVGSGYVNHNAHPGMAFYIQSPTHSAKTLINEITGFLMSQFEHIDYYEKFWPQIQANIIRQLMAPDLNSGARAQRLWISIGLADPTYDRSRRIAAAVHHLTFEQLVSHARKLIQRNSFGELVLYSFGNLDKSTDFAARSHTVHIDDLSLFKSTMPYA